VIQERGGKVSPKSRQATASGTLGKKSGGGEEQDKVTGPQHHHSEGRTEGDNSYMEKTNI